jgi:hypothetical protein
LLYFSLPVTKNRLPGCRIEPGSTRASNTPSLYRFCSRVQLSHIQEEVLNLATFYISGVYSKVQCPSLILRAEQGMMAEDDFLFPEDAAAHMLETNPWSKRRESPTSTYTIMFNPSPVRDSALQAFLAG